MCPRISQLSWLRFWIKGCLTRVFSQKFSPADEHQSPWFRRAISRRCRGRRSGSRTRGARSYRRSATLGIAARARAFTGVAA